VYKYKYNCPVVLSGWDLLRFQRLSFLSYVYIYFDMRVLLNILQSCIPIPFIHCCTLHAFNCRWNNSIIILYVFVLSPSCLLLSLLVYEAIMETNFLLSLFVILYIVRAYEKKSMRVCRHKLNQKQEIIYTTRTQNTLMKLGNYFNMNETLLTTHSV